MNTKSLETLEYNKILEQLANYAQSSLAKKKIFDLKPSVDRLEIESMQDETEAAIDLLLTIGNPPLFGISHFSPLAKKTQKGGVLSCKDLLAIAESLRLARSLLNYRKEYEEQNILTDQIQNLFCQDQLQEMLSSAILSEEELSDNASPKLYSIRRKKEDKENEIKGRLNQCMLSYAEKGYLQDNLYTMRADHYVLPVKAEYRSRVRGVVFDQSASGQTIFIEPLSLVELNNQLRTLDLEEKKEIERILADLSHEVSFFADEMIQNESLFVRIDFVFAKASYALDLGASRPIFTDNKVIDIQRAKHPLLGENVVPIDLKLGQDYTILIITGPNTGGKTVCLKTLGLITCMGQAGLQIPCREHSKLGIFESVYADIGDKQSIELSLSTFSASMGNIVSILDQCDENSLILLDEIGSGTDPTEGAALAMAILDCLKNHKIRTMATTHYAELKLYALHEDGVQNGHVEFDVKTLSPTYKLMIGLPGRSNAFEISKRLGLPDLILDQAKLRLDGENIRFEDILEEIEEKRKKAYRDEEEVERMRKSYEKELRQMQDSLKASQEAHNRYIEEEKRQAKDIVNLAKEEAKEIIRRAKLAENRSSKDLDRTLTKINEKAKDFFEILPEKKQKVKKKKSNKKNFKVGDRVYVLSMDQEGILVEGPDKKGELKVQMGILKVNAHLDDLLPAQTKEEEITYSRNTSEVKSQTVSHVSMELDLRGKRYEEAQDELDRYLDDAVLSNLSKVRIIHGKGTGALRKGVSEFLKKDSRVKHFQLADVREGGAGVTNVELQ